MAIIFLSVLFAHWIALLDTLQQFFWNYTPRPLLSTVFPNFIEGSPTLSQVTHAPRIRDPFDYSGSVDLATCFVPTTPSAMNISCSVDRSDYGLYDASSPSHHYVFLNVPVWRPAIPEQGVVPTSPTSRVEDNRTQTHMAPYRAHGLSFCPVLVGIMYIRSLLHLYMVLMIPSLCNHWFEDVLIYDSINPTELLGRSWFLHASLWMVPWYLLRCGVRKAVSCFRYIRPTACKPAYPLIPRIVLTRVDGKSVPVNCSEGDQPSVNGGTPSSFEAEESAVDENCDTTSDSRKPQDSVESFSYADGSCSATEFEAPLLLTVSHEDEHHDGIAEDQENIGSGLLASGFAKDSQIFVHQIPDTELQVSPVLVASTNEPLQHVEKDSLVPTPKPDALVETREFERMEFLGPDDTRQDIDGFGERGDSDQDPTTLSPWSLIGDPGPDGMETLPTTTSATSTSMEAQVMPTTRITAGDGTEMEDSQQVSLDLSQIVENTCAWNPGTQLVDDLVVPVQFKEIPSDPLMEKLDANSPEQVVLPVGVSEEQAEENDTTSVERFSPSSFGEPIVNLPLVTIREDMRLVQIDPIDPPTMMEDITTCSPLQISSSSVPVVIVDTSYSVAARRQSLEPVGTKQLDQGLDPAGDAPGTLNDKETVYKTSDIAYPQEDRPCWPSPSVEGSNMVCPPAVECNPSPGTLENTSAPETARESGTQFFHTTLVEEAAGTNEPRVEVLYEDPRCHADGDLAGSLHNALRGSDVSLPDVTSISKMPKGPDTEGLVNFVATKQSDRPISILTGQPGGLPDSMGIELPTTLPEHISALLDTCKEAGPLSITSAEVTSRLGDGEGCEADTMSWEDPSLTISEPPADAERTLSGSMHAPPEHLPTPQTDRNLDRTPVHDVPPSLTLEEENGGISMTTETASKRKQDLYASIHAPRRTSESEVQSSVSQSKDESNCDHQHSVTNTTVSERKPCPPNWTAMPDVVDAFRMFKQAPSENTTRRASSVAECTNRRPILGIGQKGIATRSLNNISAIANMQNCWMHGNGLLLVRDFVSSDPADFNLRSCTNQRIPRIHGMNAIPVQQILRARMLDIPPYALQNETIPRPMMSDTVPNSMVADLPGIQRQRMHHADSAQRRDRDNAECWAAYRG